MEDELSSKQKGNILETRFIELIGLGSDGRLSCFTPDSDDDGIDIMVNKKGEFKPVFFQVKSRFKLNSNGVYSQDIGTNTFRVHERFYLCFFLYNVSDYDIDLIWLIPSADFQEKAIEVNPQNYSQRLRFAASPNPDSTDKWNQYKVEKRDLAKRVERIIESIYPD